MDTISKPRVGRQSVWPARTFKCHAEIKSRILASWDIAKHVDNRGEAVAVHTGRVAKIAKDAQDCICKTNEEATELEEQVRRHAEAAGRTL